MNKKLKKWKNNYYNKTYKMFGGVQIAFYNSYLIHLYFQIWNLTNNVIFKELCLIFMISIKIFLNKIALDFAKHFMDILKPHLMPIYSKYRIVMINCINSKFSHLQQEMKELYETFTVYSSIPSVNVGPLGISF